MKNSTYYKNLGKASGTELELELEAPRTCNTGALNPSVKIDWLEFTVKNKLPVSSSRLYLDLDFSVFSLSDFGMQGYTDLYQYGAVKILHSPSKEERGTKIILSAKALNEVGRDAIDIIKDVVADGGTFARIDLALDDRTGQVTMPLIEKYITKKHDVSRFTQVEIRKPISLRTRQPVGYSIYFGKPSSSRQVVFYDKQLEQIEKTGEDHGTWVRCECRWKKRAANIFALAISQTGLASAGDIIRGVIDFRNFDDEKTERRTTCAWWEKWTNSLNIIRTGIRQIPKDIYDKCTWVNKQVKKTLGQIVAILGVRVVREMIEQGINDTSEKEWSILDPYQDKNLSRWRGELNAVCPF